MSWIWNFFAGIGKQESRDSAEEARLVEFRRRRDQRKKGNSSSDGYDSSSWSQDDNSIGWQNSSGIDTSFNSSTGGSFSQDSGPFGASDTSFGDYGGGDFGGGSDGGGGDGGGGGD